MTLANRRRLVNAQISDKTGEGFKGLAEAAVAKSRNHVFYELLSRLERPFLLFVRYILNLYYEESL